MFNYLQTSSVQDTIFVREKSRYASHSMPLSHNEGVFHGNSLFFGLSGRLSCMIGMPSIRMLNL